MILTIDRDIYKSQQEIADMYNVSVSAINQAIKAASKKGRAVTYTKLPAKMLYDIRTLPIIGGKNETAVIVCN
jgi:predicted DNA-binding protein YlxM (UPF0122 family)